MIEDQSAPLGNRRLLLVAAGVAGMLLGLLLLVTVFSGDGDDVAVGNAPATVRMAVPTTTTTVPKPPPADEVAPVEAGARDPFRQIVTVPETGPTAQAAQLQQPPPPPQPAAAQPAAAAVAPAAAPAAPAAAPAAPAATPVEPAAPAAPQPPAAPQGAAAPSTQAPASPVPAPVSPQPSPAPPGPTGGPYATLELLSISQDRAGVQRAHLTVDGHYYSPTEGEIFSYGLRLDIDGDCVEVSAPDGARVKMCLPPTAKR